MLDLQSADDLKHTNDTPCLLATADMFNTTNLCCDYVCSAAQKWLMLVLGGNPETYPSFNWEGRTADH